MEIDPNSIPNIKEVTPTKLQINDAYKHYQSLGSPKYILAPMVEQSELSFRMLTRKYGCDMAYTPMFDSYKFLTESSYRSSVFTTCPEDRPLVVQFCGNDPQVLVSAAKIVQTQCDAIDINLGCPQHMAKKCKFGAFLLDKEHWPLLKQIVSTMSQELSIPVFCKIRILKNIEDTIQLALLLQNAGCKLLVVHGRTRKQKGRCPGPANLEHIRQIKKALCIPVISNGNIRIFSDIRLNLEATGCDGVMSAEGLRSNPILFSGNELNHPADIALEYLDLCLKYNTNPNQAQVHIFKLFGRKLEEQVDLKEKAKQVESIVDLITIVKELIARTKDGIKYDRHSQILPDDPECILDDLSLLDGGSE